MYCFLCGKKIGLMRALFDRQYCSREHRFEARLVSARALRDAEDDEDEPWSVLSSKRKQAKSGATAGQTASIFAFLAVGGFIVAALTLPGPSGGGSSAPSVPLDPTIKRTLFQRAGDLVSSTFRTRAPITLRHDFQSGLSEWTTASLRPGRSAIEDLVSSPSTVRPGSLRLWKRSTSLTNYQMEFMGQIEKKSLSWAFRAADEKNYYATKITIARPGSLPNAGLVRYVMMDGREWDRINLPLPLTLERGQSYRVRVSVQDDHFITSVNGQVISSWKDKRLHRGGVGFFADDDDSSVVRWVSISERDSFLGRMLAHFTLLTPPGSPLSPFDEE
jgi:hypothetical protein